MFNKRNEPDSDRLDNLNIPPVPGPSTPAIPQRASREPATIGPSIRIHGDLSGEEDLVVQGTVEGTITLKQNKVTVGKDGHVSATVHARVVNVEGRLEGDMHGDEQVVLHRSAHVQGNIVAPRVTLEDGCRFKGSIDMDVAPEAKARNVAEIKSAKGQEQQPAAGSPRVTGA